MAATVQQSGLGLEASEQSCALSRPGNVFEAIARQAFYRLILANVAATDRLTIDWVDPNGAVSVSVPYEQLPAAPALCFVSQLPIAGFAPASQPGEWRVRVLMNGVVLRENTFRIKADPQASGVVIRAANLREVSAAESELVIDGLGFAPDSVVNIAQYTASGGWTYLHHLFPATFSAARITVRLPALAAAEYLVILRNADGRLSAPARFVISRSGYYRLPTPSGQAWMLTQGPYGSFSHRDGACTLTILRRLGARVWWRCGAARFRPTTLVMAKRRTCGFSATTSRSRMTTASLATTRICAPDRSGYGRGKRWSRGKRWRRWARPAIRSGRTSMST